MSKLNVDQKTVKELFENKKADFNRYDMRYGNACRMRQWGGKDSRV